MWIWIIIIKYHGINNTKITLINEVECNFFVTVSTKVFYFFTCCYVAA